MTKEEVIERKRLCDMVDYRIDSDVYETTPMEETK